MEGSGGFIQNRRDLSATSAPSPPLLPVCSVVGDVPSDWDKVSNDHKKCNLALSPINEDSICNDPPSPPTLDECVWGIVSSFSDCIAQARTSNHAFLSFNVGATDGRLRCATTSTCVSFIDTNAELACWVVYAKIGSPSPPPPSPPAPLPMPSPPSHPGCNRSSIADRSILRDGYDTELEPGSYCNAADQTCDFCEGLSEDDCLRSYVDPGGCSPTAGHPLARCTGYDPSTYVGGGCTQGCYACTWDTTSDPPNPYCKAVGGGTLFFCDPPPSPPAPLPMPSPPSHPGCNRSSIADRSILRDGYATELEPGSYCNAADQTCDFCEGLSEDDCLRSYVDPGWVLSHGRPSACSMHWV